MANALEILITGKDQFSPKARQAQRSAKGLKGGMASLGKTAFAVGAGFIAAQASIMGVQKLFTSTIGAAMKFEAQLAQIRALTGATKEDTDFLSGAIKDLSREIGKSPAELGAAAYFILSSGIEDAADAAGVLEIAAKASTIGLGETEKVADALTTVINAYGMSAGDAAHVTDVMIEAVKQGKAEASEFAGVLGRVVPIASQMGISFEEVSANLATFTLLGVSAQEAATGLRAVMSSLLKPTTDQEEAMAELGLSAEGLRKQIKEKGLLATLDSMMKATGGNEAAVAKLFPNIRALTSVLGTAGVQMDSYTDILAATENATGNLKEGFAIISETAQQKMKVAMAELNIIMLELGEKVLPVVILGTEALSGAIEDVGLITGILSGDMDDLNTATEKSTDNWLNWIGVSQLGSSTGTVLGKTIRGIADNLLGVVSLSGDFKDALKALADEQKALTEITKAEGAATKDTTAETLLFDAALRRIAASTGIDIELLQETGLSVEELKKEFEKGGVSIGLSAREIQGEIGRIKQRALDMAEAMENEVAPAAVMALEAIEDAADDARSALTDMFRATTQEEIAAEIALNSLRQEAARLEGKVGDLTGKERERLDQINNDLIPAEQNNLEQLRLGKEGVELAAKAQVDAFPTQAEYAANIALQTEKARLLKVALGEIPSTLNLKIALGLAQTAELDFIRTVIAAGGWMQAVPMQHGGIVTRPTLALIGERGPEAVIPLSRGSSAPAMGGTTINLTVNIDTMIGGEDAGAELAEIVLPHIRRAVA